MEFFFNSTYNTFFPENKKPSDDKSTEDVKNVVPPRFTTKSRLIGKRRENVSMYIPVFAQAVTGLPVSR